MHDSTLETRLAELESRLAFQEITIEDLNKTVTAHEIEMAKMREHMRLMIEKLKATQPSHIASRGRKKRHRRTIEGVKKAGFPAFCRLRAEAQRLVAAAATVAAAAAFTMVVTMIVAVAAAATVMTMVMIVIVAMRAVHVTVLQLFRSASRMATTSTLNFRFWPASMWLPSTTTWSSSTSVISTGTGP